MKKKKVFAKLSALMLVAAMAVTPVAASAEEAPRVGGDLVVGLQYEPDIMNVYSTHLLGDPEATIVEGLLVPNSEMVYVPVLATEVPTEENGGIVMNDDGTMTMTYHLRDDVSWHCGEKFTSADVLATWEALKNPEWDAESKDGVADIDSIELPDDYTVVLHYNTITPDYADSLFTFGIMPKHAIDGVDMNDPNNGYNNSPCGTGPYKFDEWVSGEYVRVVRNDNYWGPEGPYLNSITFRFVTDENTRINMLKAGEIDFAYNISYTNYEQVSNIEGYTATLNPQNSWRYFDMNFGVPGLDDLAVRRAIACAIDKDALVNQLFSGLPTAWDQPWMPSDPYHVDGFKSEWSFDLDRANALLDEAGWVMGSDGVRAKDGVRLEFVAITRSGSATDSLIAQVVTSYLSQIGIKMTTEEYASATMVAKMYAGDYQIGIGGYITSPSVSRTQMYAIGGSLNRGQWNNEEFTELCHKIDGEINPEVRKELVKQALAIFDSELPQLVLYNNNEVDVISNKLHGYKLNPTNMTNFCQTATWWMEE